MSSIARFIANFLPAILLAGHGLRKRSLSPSGALAAFIVGSLMFSAPLWTFGVSLIVFYFIGSRATKYGKQLKATLEDGYEGNEAGNRSAAQVLCNSFAAAAASSLWSIAFVPSVRDLLDQLLAQLRTYDINLSVRSTGVSYSPTAHWCPTDRAVAGGLSRALIFAVLGHFATCLGDTLASELGILSRTPPILITTLKTVPPGTNGGLSLLGTAASGLGGLIMGFTMSGILVLENNGCRSFAVSTVAEFVAWGGLAGIVGSMIDSLLGATVQRTRYSNDRKRVLQDDTVVKAGEADVKIISGWDLLTNNQVNFFSSAITAVGLALIA